jgi:hypothetical protein
MAKSINLSTFYARMGMLMLVLVFAGFVPVMVARLGAGGTMTPALIAHGVCFLVWLLLFIVQAGLIGGKNLKLHMTLGKSSLVLAALMVVTSIIVIQHSYASGSTGGTPFPPKHFIILPLMDIVLFVVFYTLAFLKRGSPLTHKHLMLFVGIMMLDPATGRLGLTLGMPPVALLLHFSLVALVWLHDKKTHGQIHTVTKWATVVLVLRYAGLFVVGPTEAWAKFVTMLFGS